MRTAYRIRAHRCPQQRSFVALRERILGHGAPRMLDESFLRKERRHLGARAALQRPDSERLRLVLLRGIEAGAELERSLSGSALAPLTLRNSLTGRNIALPHSVPRRRSTMRTFLWFLGLLLAGFAAMALFAYPAWLLLHPHFNFPFHRIASRVGMLALLIGFVSVARRLGLADRSSLGYGVARRVFIREGLLGLALGVVLMLLVVVVMAGLGLRVLQPGVELDAATLAAAALQALGSALAVALIEETFLRGAMFSGVARESGTGRAILLTALVYAATHFIARYRIPAELVGPTSGLAMVAGSLGAFADPLSMGDAFLALFSVGVLLAAIRAATGNIAACVGLHAGWVWVMLLARTISVPDTSRRMSFLLSGFDGFVGWLVLGWTLVIGWPLYQFYVRRSASIQPAG